MRKAVVGFVALFVFVPVLGVLLGVVQPVSAHADPHEFAIEEAVSVGEAGPNASVDITVTPAPEVEETLTVDWATSDSAPGTATPDVDYTESFGTETFTATVDTQTITVPVANDAIHEGDETFLINIFSAQGSCSMLPCMTSSAEIVNSQATVTITDNDPQPNITINNVTVPEGDEGTVPATFTVSRNGGTVDEVTVFFETVNGTASTPGDYESNSGTLTFAPSNVTAQQPVPVDVVGDTVNEANETFFVNLSAQTNATISDNQGIGTITDDDVPASLEIDDVIVTEGDAGTTTATFTVTKSGTTEQTVGVNFATANNTATAPSDYTARPSTPLSFGPGETSKAIDVNVNGELVREPPIETFFVNLSGETNATISKAQGVGTIEDDDPQPSLAINNASVTEGDAGDVVTAQFTVTKTGATDEEVTVEFATEDGTAEEPGDYEAQTATLTFPPGVSTQPVDVIVEGDTVAENDETFFVELTNATNATISVDQGTGTIIDDEPRINISDGSATEGGDVTFTVTISEVITEFDQSATVDFDTEPVAGTATQGSDYPHTQGSLTFTAGEPSDQITVPATQDVLDEPDPETFVVNLKKPIEGCCAGGYDYIVGDGTGEGTIIDDDPVATSLAIDDVTVTEGSSGTPIATFTVTKTGATGQTVTVDFATANDTAVAPGDYATKSGTLEFAPGDSTKTIPIDIVPDTLDEPDEERFFVNLSGETFATVSDAQGVGTIEDDDAATASLAIGNVTVTEGDSGTTEATFTVTKTGTTEQTVTVDFATANDTAVAPGDYATKSGTLEFAPADTTETITIEVAGEKLVEDDETFFVNLSNESNATISDAQGAGSIIDDDHPAGHHDFNGDGFADAAFGVPGQDLPGLSNAGAVNVIYGSASGLSATTTADQVWTLDTTEVAGTAVVNDRFGASMSFGDLNGDGFTDLTIGAPGKGSGAGAVAVLHGSSAGLTGTGSQLFQQGAGGVEDSAESGDGFGSSLAVGDLDGDGFADLAVGAPGEDVGALTDAGAVNVLYGSVDGLVSTDDQLWHQDSTDVGGAAEAGDRFGASVAAGDVNGDGRDDLAVGVSGEDVGAASDGGAVNVLLGSASGLTGTGSQLWHQDVADVEDTAESRDNFGAAVVTGDFNGDAVNDLAVGVKFEDVGSKVNAGAVNVLYGSNAGLVVAGDQFWSQDSPGIQGTAERADVFGQSLAAGDFDGDLRDDLAIGAPGEGIGAAAKAGAANVLYGSAAGLTTTDDDIWHQNVAGVAGKAEKTDTFGAAVGAADVNGDAKADLIVGAPREDIGSKSDAGSANVLYGSAVDLTTTGNQLWHENVADVEGTAASGDNFAAALG